MSPELIELARRAIACKGWRWMPGMLAIRWTGPCRGSHRYTDAEVRAGVTFYRGTPDLSDPATLGCLLALVRESRKEPMYLPTCLHDEAWIVDRPSSLRQTRYESEAEALVAALVAAP